MLLPISHDDATVHSWPWVTWSLMAACVLAFLVTHLGEREARAASDELFTETVGYFFDHPYLELDERVIPADLLAELPIPALRASATARLEQRELDELTALWLDSLAEHPLWSGGLIPTAPTVAGHLTHLFLHAGWLHLIGNLLFLYLTGPFLEDRWGRWPYLALFTVGGVVSAMVFVSAFPGLYRPLVGASGAVSAVMAGFLIEFWRTRISFMFAPLFPLPPFYTFALPAWLVLPGWFLKESAGAWGAAATSQLGGIAHHAHVGGFAFGLAVAAVRLWLRRGSRSTRSERSRTELLVQARAAALQGNTGGAWMLVSQRLAEDPADDEAALLLWALARKQPGQEEATAPVLEQVIRREVRGGRHEEAIAHWRELVLACPEHRVEPALEVAILELLDRRGASREVAGRLALALEGLPEATPVGVVLRLLRLAGMHAPLLDSRSALARRALADPSLSPAERDSLQAIAG